jgi:hypothetical protein
MGFSQDPWQTINLYANLTNVTRADLSAQLAKVRDCIGIECL